MWYTHKFFKYSTGIILVLLILFLLGKVGYILNPLKSLFATLFLPMLLSAILYYLLRPLVQVIEKLKIPRIIAILISFILVLILLVLIVTYSGQIFVSEFNQLFRELPKFVSLAGDKITEFIRSNNLDLSFIPLNDLVKKATDFAQALGMGIFNGIASFISTLTVLLLVPFIVFYLLKDQGLASRGILSILPEKYKDEGQQIIDDVDKTISSYLTGQAIVMVVIGVMMYIGYVILGLRYALILSIFSMITAVIPFIGAFIGIIPAMLIGLSYNPLMLLKIFILMQIVQNIEGNLITPQIMKRQMKIHPVTVILVILTASSLFGFLGMLLAIPSYAVLKVIINNLLKIYKLSKFSA